MNQCMYKKKQFTYKNTEEAIIACGSLFHEFESIKTGNNKIHYLPSDLHRTPSKISTVLQAKINQISHNCGTIILGYGLCANGLLGISAPRQQLILPRVHDCIELFMGFTDRGKSRAGLPTTHYYLTPGNILNNKDPLNIMEKEYVPRMGKNAGEWGMKEELKHYTHFVLITTQRDDMETIRRQAIANANFFDMKLLEKKSDLEYLKKILNGPYDIPGDFIILNPGVTVTQHMFM